jgi:uncharacterized protein (TIRG00374 family)
MNLKKRLITLSKIVISLAIIGYLFYKLIGTPKGWDAFVKMLWQHKDWDLLAGGFVFLLMAVMITIVRWWYLVRALGIDFSMPAAVRIGFLGYFFNFAPTGIAGGDLLKAWMLAREKPGNRAKALASVVVDRIIGLYVLFLVAAAGVFITGFWDIADTTVHRLCLAVLIVTLVSTVGIVLILLPGFLEWRLIRGLTRIPKIGHAIESLLEAIQIYRSKRLVLFLTSLMSVPVHGFLTLSLLLLALGLKFDRVPARDYFAIYPISGIAQTIPLPAGPAETGIVFFYETAWLRLPEIQAEIKTGTEAEKLKRTKELEETAGRQGLILALVYRLSTILIVPIGAAYYFFGGRSEVTEVLHEVEAEDGDGTGQDGKPG